LFEKSHTKKKFFLMLKGKKFTVLFSIIFLLRLGVMLYEEISMGKWFKDNLLFIIKRPYKL